MNIKTYNLFVESLNESDVSKICKKYRITNWSINRDGLIDVDGNVNLNQSGLTKLPIKFGEVTGDFSCQHNQLTTLEGAPQSVGGDFSCRYNQLTTLEGAPQSVGGDFLCRDNQLTTLEGSPQSVGGYFYCSDNQLTTLEGSPQSVGGDFSCRYNQLTTLEGAPQSVGGDFSCRYNQLINFTGFPEFYDNSDDSVDFRNNPVAEIYQLFRNPKAIYWINEFDVIQGNSIIEDRLIQVYNQLGIEVPRTFKFKNYKLI
jgi:hypothetical protein